MSDAKSSFAPTDRSRIRRNNKRAVYDKDAVFAVVDATPLCHVGYSIDGQPYVTPTLHWREGEVMYWHGSSASRMLKAVKTGIPVCLTVTHFDGFVMARSAFSHSANYRTAMIYGQARAIEDVREKERSLKVMMDLLFPGRWEELRDNTDQELKATTVVEMPIDNAVAKIRTGPPGDEEEDYAARCWAGVLPRSEVWSDPVPDPRLSSDIAVPGYLDRLVTG